MFKAFSWRRSIPLVTSRKIFGHESILIVKLKASLLTQHINDSWRSVENITRHLGRNISKQPTGSRGEETLLENEKVLTKKYTEYTLREEKIAKEKKCEIKECKWVAENLWNAELQNANQLIVFGNAELKILN